ncbi:beta-lactamase family protein [Virgibacillus halodenitrificans]|uniref:serine hydrolase domain-containing protein n=1 Tax=Virgibacillus halodenitrificans TaxID=1482 RepID=UPI001FB4D8DA|nr:serine hydrolase [Virgibacillus halodenitrificans]MCJ0933271.1 beta-lactamase family protein [Virgibacillus halodenitrificans]
MHEKLSVQKQMDFSGVVYVQRKGKVEVEKSYGYANRSHSVKNNIDTRFGIASGCKLFTAIAICQLVEQDKLSFHSKLSECLPYEFKHIDLGVTVHQLLTHTSGIPDYFDEEEMDDFEELWEQNPMYLLRKPADFLPMFSNKPMKFTPGEKFHYNNAGYILLGLIIEAISGMAFSQYVEKYIFRKAAMVDSGYFSLDSLPANTALGYIELPGEEWKTNIYSLPVKGGPDGGAFVTAEDMTKLWSNLIHCKLLNEETTKILLSPMIQANKNVFYGYGVWISKNSTGEILKYHVMGYDPGVSFHSAYYPQSSFISTICLNKSEGAFEMMRLVEEIILEK